jgi:hypothetical protein
VEDAAAGPRRQDFDRRTDLPGRADPGIGAPEVLWTTGCLVVLGCTLILIAGLTWGAGRINKAEPTSSKTELQPSAQS